jgi:hypothetical protein
MDNVTGCIAEMHKLLGTINLPPGGLSHALAQMQLAVEQKTQALQQQAQGAIIALEHKVSGSIGGVNFERYVDVVVQKAAGALTTHVELKTHKELQDALNQWQGLKDATLAVTGKIRNEWGMLGLTLADQAGKLDAQAKTTLTDFMRGIRDDMKGHFSTAEIHKALESFRFVDQAGAAFKAVVQKNGHIIFEPAADTLLGEGGTVQRVFAAAAGNSPNFRPAMDELLGPSGKMADTATAAAKGANFNPAEKSLEQNIEKGVSEAMEEAGKKSAAHGAKELGKKIGDGVMAVSNIMTSIPQLYDQVTKLGEAWDKPNKTTKDYMDLMSAAGGVLSQGVQVVQALAGVTQIASAAQSVFNAIAAMNPYVLIVIAVIALIAAIVLLIVYWDKVKAFLRDNPWISVIIAMTGIIGLIIVVIAYWDEIKLAVLKAANFISIQVQKIGQFFVGLKNLIGMVWDFIVASVENVGISIVNAFITIGVAIQNFFIGIINAVLEQYNALADSAAGQLAGLTKTDLIPKVELETKLIPPKEVPKVDIEAAFKTTGPVTGGLEGQIAKQEDVVAKAKAADEERRRKEREAKPAPGAPGTPALPGTPAMPTTPAMPAGAAAPPGGLPRPELPAAAATAAGAVDQSVHVAGGINVTINADRLEADASKLLSDEIISAIQSRLGSLRSEQDFRTGTRAPA